MKHWSMAILACLSVLAMPVKAENYPQKSVRIIVGYPPGGASDTVARMLAQQLEKLNDQPFVIENKPGVGGMLSLSTVSKSHPDGYTLGLGVSGTLVIGPHLQKSVPYDVKTDFSPIGMIAKVPMVLLAGPGLHAENVKGLIKIAREKPGEIIFGSGAQAFELAMQLINSHAKIDTTSATYKGGAAAAIDVIAGRVPIMVDSIGAQFSSIKEGRLRALAVLDSTRSAVLPDVPTMKEAGVPEYEAVGWIGLVGPKGMDSAIVDKLNEQLRQIVNAPEFSGKLLSLGFQPATGSASGLMAAITSEYDKWGKVVREAGMTPQ